MTKFLTGVLLGFIITLMFFRAFAIYTVKKHPNITLNQYWFKTQRKTNE